MRVKWTDECEAAFHHLKAALCAVATLHVPEFDKPFHIITEESRCAIGAVHEQVDEATGDHSSLAFLSWKLAPRQMQWSPRELETYTIICAPKKYQSRVGTNRVEVLTDHRSGEYWATEHIDTILGPARRWVRWHTFPSLFDLHVSFLPGKHNMVADALSRWAAKYQHPWYEAGPPRRNRVGSRKKNLIRRECMQFSVKRHALPCHDITAFSDPAHANESLTKSLKVVEKFKNSSSESVERTKYTRHFGCSRALNVKMRPNVEPCQKIHSSSLTGPMIIWVIPCSKWSLGT